MNKDRMAQIRQRQQQNKRLQQQTRRMQEQLQKIRHLKQMQTQKLMLQQEMKELDLNQDKKKKLAQDTTNLREYGKKLVQKHNEKVEQKIKKLTKQMMEEQASSQEEGNEKEDGENVRYFLQVMGMEKYFQALRENKIFTLEKLKAVKEPDLKKLQIPLKDMVAINKKLRTMGIS